MGAMARQVLQVKRKNSTSCKPPDERLTVVGSVASRLGPREVATGCASLDGVADKSSSVYVAVRSTDGVASANGVWLGKIFGSAEGDVGRTVDVAGVHAINKT